MTSKHCVFGSDGIELHFPDKEMYDRYEEDCKKLAVKYYREIREKHGVWASNQGKFVPSANDLRHADCKHMENLAAASPDVSRSVVRSIEAARGLLSTAQSNADYGSHEYERLEAIDADLRSALRALTGAVAC